MSTRLDMLLACEKFSHVLCRLREQQQEAGIKLEQQQAAAARAVAEECERHVGAERALQQQVQQLKSDLAVAQVNRTPVSWMLECVLSLPLMTV